MKDQNNQLVNLLQKMNNQTKDGKKKDKSVEDLLFYMNCVDSKQYLVSQSKSQ